MTDDEKVITNLLNRSLYALKKHSEKHKCAPCGGTGKQIVDRFEDPVVCVKCLGSGYLSYTQDIIDELGDYLSRKSRG